MADKLEERKTLRRAHHVLVELVGAKRATPLQYKKGLLTVQCTSPTTAHYLRTCEDRVRTASQAEKVRFIV